MYFLTHCTPAPRNRGVRNLSPWTQIFILFVLWLECAPRLYKVSDITSNLLTRFERGNVTLYIGVLILIEWNLCENFCFNLLITFLISIEVNLCKFTFLTNNNIIYQWSDNISINFCNVMDVVMNWKNVSINNIITAR